MKVSNLRVISLEPTFPRSNFGCLEIKTEITFMRKLLTLIRIDIEHTKNTITNCLKLKPLEPLKPSKTETYGMQTKQRMLEEIRCEQKIECVRERLSSVVRERNKAM